MVAPIEPHIAAVQAALESVDLVAGVARVPDGAGWQGTPGHSSFVPYHVIWPIPGTMFDGTLAEAEADASVIVQLSSWAADEYVAQVNADTARAAIQTVTVTDRALLRVRWVAGLGLMRDDSLQPPLWQQADQYRIDTTPA